MMKKIEKESTTRKWGLPARCYICLLIIYFCIMINWQLPVIRLESSTANYIVMLFVFSIPILLVPLAFCSKGWGLKILGAIVPLPFIPMSLLFGFFSWIMLTNIWNTGIDSSFERLESIKFGHSKIAVYRTNGGATTDFGIYIRQEMTILPGVLLVRRIESIYSAYEAKVYNLRDNTVKVIVAPYGKQDEKNLTLTLKRWVYI